MNNTQISSLPTPSHKFPNESLSTGFERTLQQVLIPYGLKEVTRAAKIGDRKESVSEHIGSGIGLARWFMRNYDLKLDVGRVVDLFSFHDLHELDSGDTPIIPGVNNQEEKRIKELAAINTIAERFDPREKSYYLEIISDYVNGTTPEARFVKAVDKLDADLQFLGNKSEWAGWTEEFYREKREAHCRRNPATSEFFDQLLQHLRTNGYFEVPLATS